MFFTEPLTRKIIYSTLSVSMLLGLSAEITIVHADECGVLKLQINRSPGATVTHNACSEAPFLAIDAIVLLQAGSRVWLESVAASNPEKTQIICQNKSTRAIEIKINSDVSPYINPEGLTQCTQWTNSRLECHDSNNNDLFCASAQIKKLPAVTALQQKTSISMRGFKSLHHKALTSKDPQQELNQWITYLKPEIDLCRKTYQVTQPITLSWKIKSSGQVTEMTLKESITDKQFADCAIDVIQNSDFPTFDHDTQVSFSF